MCKKDQLLEYSIQDIVDMISTDQNIEYDEAMNKFYNSEVFEKLVDTFYPAWRPNAPLSYYGDQPSGFIVFLRVYRVQDKLDERLLIKGRQGSSQIIQLYNEQGITSVETEILEPVLHKELFFQALL